MTTTTLRPAAARTAAAAPSTPSARQIRVVIADDHLMVREGLAHILETEADLRVVGRASDGLQTLELLEQLRPASVRAAVFADEASTASETAAGCDLLVMDMVMPPPRGPELIRAVRERWPALPVLVVSMHAQAGVVQAALRAGAQGYLTKGSDPEAFIAAARKVAGGGHWIDPTVADALLFGREPANPAHERLTPRERQVLARLIDGQNNQQIAAALYLSEKTVSTHKSNIMDKLGVASVAGLVRYAQEHMLGNAFDPGA